MCCGEGRQRGFLEAVSTQLQETSKQAEAGKHFADIYLEDSFSQCWPGLEDW